MIFKVHIERNNKDINVTNGAAYSCIQSSHVIHYFILTLVKTNLKRPPKSYKFQRKELVKYFYQYMS